MIACLPLLYLALPALQDPAGQAAPAAAESQVAIPIREDEDFYYLNFSEAGDEADPGGVDLESLTKVCQQATGINFTYDEVTGTELKGKKVKIFGTKRIPKTEFYSFFQIIMFINQFVCTKVGPDPLSVVVIQSLAPARGAAATNLQSEAIYVLPDELDAYASQVATPIITVLHLPHTDVRQLGNSLRALTPQDPNQGVIPVGATNSVILRGYASSVVSLARILQLVDRESAADTGVNPVFQVIPLQWAAAQDIADMVEQLLEASRRVQERNRTIVQQGATAPLPQSGGAETKIMVDPRTNSLLIMALPDDMQNVKELIAQLDVEVIEPERSYHVYALENVAAEELAEVLENFIDDASRLAARSGQATPAGQPGPAPSSNDNQVVVVPDPTTNALLIAAGKSRYEEVLELIRKLDRRQDQVLIETALIELSGTDSLSLGVELGYVDDPVPGNTGSFGVTSFGLSEITFNGQTPVRTPVENLGITAGILDGDNFQIPLLLNALRNRRDTNVLNVPSVLVNNNGSAQVKSTDSQPTTTITLGTGGTAATQENFNGYEDAGITMDISPSISASGYLRLRITLDVSNFQGTFQGAIPPPKTTRTIDTSVSVPDGDTMVIGGIITDNSSDSRTSVPLLGDVPILGRLFSNDTTNEDYITLYFFVTPHILRDKDFADLSEISYQKKLEAADKIGVHRIRKVDPRFNPGGKQVDMGGFEVPLYRSPAGGEVDPDSVGLDPVRRAELLGEKGIEQPPPPAQEPPGAKP